MEISSKLDSGPFLRWTGSKRWLIKDHLTNYLPNSFNNYHEPFLGSGSVFFYLKKKIIKNKSYYLSDSNEELINTFIQIRDNPYKVIEYLKEFKNTEEYYYKIRNLKPKSKERRAARFIYLNRTSFNGIYRVNSKGQYNVPYGKREKVDFITENLILRSSHELQNVNIKYRSFEESLIDVNQNDLVFLDPPYTIAHENNGFIEYNQNLFSWKDQEKLKEYIKGIIKKKAYFILTNACHFSILELYNDIGSNTKLSRHSKVGGRNKTRGLYNELIIYNTIN